MNVTLTTFKRVLDEFARVELSCMARGVQWSSEATEGCTETGNWRTFLCSEPYHGIRMSCAVLIQTGVLQPEISLSISFTPFSNALGAESRPIIDLAFNPSHNRYDEVTHPERDDQHRALAWVLLEKRVLKYFAKIERYNDGHGFLSEIIRMFMNGEMKTAFG